MLRDLSLIILLVNSGLLVFAGLPRYAVCLLIIAIITFRLKPKYSHVLGKELNFLSSKLLRGLVIMLAVYFAIVAATFLGSKESVPLFAALTLSISPLLILFALHSKVAASTSELAQFRAIRFLRTLLQLKSGLFFLVLMGIMGLLQFRLLPAITFIQILIIEAALIAPYYALQYDKSRFKMLRVTDRNLRTHTLSNKALHGYLGYGILAAVISYINYMLVFTRHNLNPYYLDLSLPLYHQATTVAMVTFVFCMILAFMFERVDKHEFFINEHTLDNLKLVKAMGLTVLILAIVSYTPGLNDFLDTAPLDVYDWLTALLAACAYAGLRMIKRGSRKHSRQAVLKLHRQVRPNTKI